MKILTMPSFGADMAKGSIVKWNVKPGDHVSKGDIVASIETMKGLIDMEVYDEGTITKLVAVEGEELEIGRPIAELQLTNEESSNNKPEQIPTDAALPSVETITTQVVNLSGKQDKEDKKTPNISNIPDHSELKPKPQIPKISPAARFRAKELGIDWRQLAQGNGPNGALQLNDINAVYEMHPEPQESPSDLMRQAIASTVSRSKRDIPHYYLQLDMLLDNAVRWLREHNADLPPNKRILINAVIYSAIARALTSFPAFNGFYRDGHYESSDSVHLGNAISLRQGGLMVAAIHDAQHLGLIEMMEKITDQVNRARKGGLRMSEMQEATVTVSNLGDRGSDSIQSIILPPQVAIFGIGRQRTVPWIVDNTVSCASIVSMSLAADHRVSDGHLGARLLNKINKYLQKPETLI
ncbi:dihydrolipoamide acetyltransferase family protein [uncultured Paraglaciecola sp.]|uniref:dihydrolipoamide acetyltransferase family protein n=1 Tax=uncultured Paraglaciecola sp. TaxID=1765024 RepID=UPI0025DCB02A|nr:dihydrolipoamide acetyltransferase family protein [uncultured Paraglaciecola sp.]